MLYVNDIDIKVFKRDHIDWDFSVLYELLNVFIRIYNT